MTQIRAESGIVAEGWGRARKALEQRVRAEVEAEFADVLARGDRIARACARLAVEREIWRRLEERVPRKALY